MALCYESSWLFPVLVISGGLTTGGIYAAQRFYVSKKRNTSLVQAPISDVPPSSSADDIELQSTSILRRRQAGTDSDADTPKDLTAATSDAPELGANLLVKPWMTLVALSVFVTFLITAIIVRSQLSSPPRAFNFMTDLLIGGSIIFGGGPVVIVSASFSSCQKATY